MGVPLILGFVFPERKMNEAEELVAGLLALQQEGLLCDVELQADDQSISAHRAVLAAASEYFKAMFCGNFKVS